MSRIPKVAFRIPTDEELDALAAYQLALGRQEDFDLPALQLKSALATNGKALFLDSGSLSEPGHKNCNACHFNGGGSAGMSFNPSMPGLPRDGGFGQVPTVFGSFGNTDDLPPPFGHFELEEFNSPAVVESADTGPFFHNHTVSDLESAVAFSGTTAFTASLVPTAIPVDISGDPNDPEVQAIAAFLRVLNALENIRSSIDVAERGRTMSRVADMRDLARLSLAETSDGLKVLSEGALAAPSEPAVRSARLKLIAARVALELAQHVRVRRAIDNLLSVALQQLRGAQSALANPATLPPSFRN